VGRIIINNRSSAPDDVAIALVLDCVNAGRIGNDGLQYCYASKYECNGGKYILTSALNHGSDSFTLQDTK
jgi:hypothetical protein